jgi:hypothetical protein
VLRCLTAVLSLSDDKVAMCFSSSERDVIRTNQKQSLCEQLFVGSLCVYARGGVDRSVLDLTNCGDCASYIFAMSSASAGSTTQRLEAQNQKPRPNQPIRIVPSYEQILKVDTNTREFCLMIYRR